MKLTVLCIGLLLLGAAIPPTQATGAIGRWWNSWTRYFRPSYWTNRRASPNAAVASNTTAMKPPLKPVIAVTAVPQAQVDPTTSLPVYILYKRPEQPTYRPLFGSLASWSQVARRGFSSSAKALLPL